MVRKPDRASFPGSGLGDGKIADGRVCVAQFGAAHGTAGEIRLRAFTQDPQSVMRYGALETEDGARTFEIAALRPAGPAFIARVAGVNDRNAAEQLTNLRLYVARERLPEPEDSETFYHADLIGLEAVGTDGVDIGTVTAVHDFGAGDLLEIKPRRGGPTILLPFTRTVVPVVDLTGGRLTVEPPEGLLASGEAAEPRETRPSRRRSASKRPAGEGA